MKTTRTLTFPALAGLFVWYLLSPLAFSPVPWPDASAFYLPGLDLALGRGWRMHAQAAFVPTYDLANFNTMPLLPFLFALLIKLGLTDLMSATLLTRAVSLIPLFAFASFLARWIHRDPPATLPRWKLAATLSLGAWVALDPVLRWGTQVVRTETWVMLCGLFLIIQINRLASRETESDGESPVLWRIAAALALAAGFHFEAVLLVPAAITGLWPWNLEGRAALRAFVSRNLKVGARTLLLLSPWIVYVLMNFGLFVQQMDVQFTRLDQRSNVFLTDWYTIYQSLFLATGSAVAFPKIFNPAKALFWILLVTLSIRTLYVLWLARSGRSILPETLRAVPASVASMVLTIASLYLWFTKPEVWFITIIHFAMAIWLAAQIRVEGRRSARAFIVAAAVFAVFSLMANIEHQRRMPKDYNWKTYQAWIDCIDRTILRYAKATEPGAALRIWQPHIPDALVELSQRQPEYDYTRAMDFPKQTHLAWEYALTADVIIHSRHLPDERNSYEGEERRLDQQWLAHPIDSPYGDWTLERLERVQPGARKRYICQSGPFWANLAIKR